MADGLEPYEFRGFLEVTNCRFYAGGLVDVVDSFHCIWADVFENFKVGKYFSSRGDEVYGVKGLGSGGSIEYESVCV